MWEIKSNFGISLDLFELATFDTNYGLQTADKAITGCTKVALRYFGLFLAKRRLKMIDTLLIFSENLTIQNVPGAKVQRIEILRLWWLLCGRYEARNILFKPILVDACWQWGYWILLCSILSLRHISDNIRHLFWPHGRWIRPGIDHRLYKVCLTQILMIILRCL